MYRSKILFIIVDTEKVLLFLELKDLIVSLKLAVILTYILLTPTSACPWPFEMHEYSESQS